MKIPIPPLPANLITDAPTQIVMDPVVVQYIHDIVTMLIVIAGLNLVWFIAYVFMAWRFR